MASPPFSNPYCQPSLYSWSSSISYYGYGPPGGFGPPPPPPPYTPFVNNDDVDRRYKTPDTKRIKIHVIKKPRYASPSSLFSGRGIHLDFEGYNLPTSLSIREFFEAVDAFKHKNAVIEEAVEEGNGCWSRGAKLYWGCQKPDSLKNVRWRRSSGLQSASKEVVWVLIRPRTYDDE